MSAKLKVKRGSTASWNSNAAMNVALPLIVGSRLTQMINPLNIYVLGCPSETWTDFLKASVVTSTGTKTVTIQIYESSSGTRTLSNGSSTVELTGNPSMVMIDTLFPGATEVTIVETCYESSYDTDTGIGSGLYAQITSRLTGGIVVDHYSKLPVTVEDNTGIYLYRDSQDVGTSWDITFDFNGTMVVATISGGSYSSSTSTISNFTVSTESSLSIISSSAPINTNTYMAIGAGWIYIPFSDIIESSVISSLTSAAITRISPSNHIKAAVLTNKNTTLEPGQPGIEYTLIGKSRLKVGDSTATKDWSELPYAENPSITTTITRNSISNDIISNTIIGNDIISGSNTYKCGLNFVSSVDSQGNYNGFTDILPHGWNHISLGSYTTPFYEIYTGTDLLFVDGDNSVSHIECEDQTFNFYNEDKLGHLSIDLSDDNLYVIPDNTNDSRLGTYQNPWKYVCTNRVDGPGALLLLSGNLDTALGGLSVDFNQDDEKVIIEPYSTKSGNVFTDLGTSSNPFTAIHSDIIQAYDSVCTPSIKDERYYPHNSITFYNNSEDSSSIKESMIELSNTFTQNSSLGPITNSLQIKSWYESGRTVTSIVPSTSTSLVSHSLRLGSSAYDITGYIKFLYTNYLYNGGTSSEIYCGCNFLPTTNSVSASTGLTLGSSTRKWTAVYSYNGSIQTSDRSAKSDIKYLSQNEAISIPEGQETNESFVTMADVVDFIKELEPATFCYRDANGAEVTESDASSEAIQLGLIADDICNSKLFKYIGTEDEIDDIIEPEERDETTGQVTKEAVIADEKKTVRGLQPIPLATAALATCKYLLGELEGLTEDIESLRDELNQLRSTH